MIKSTAVVIKEWRHYSLPVYYGKIAITDYNKTDNQILTMKKSKLSAYKQDAFFCTRNYKPISRLL